MSGVQRQTEWKCWRTRDKRVGAAKCFETPDRTSERLPATRRRGEEPLKYHRQARRTNERTERFAKCLGDLTRRIEVSQLITHEAPNNEWGGSFKASHFVKLKPADFFLLSVIINLPCTVYFSHFLPLHFFSVSSFSWFLFSFATFSCLSVRSPSLPSALCLSMPPSPPLAYSEPFPFRLVPHLSTEENVATDYM